MKSNFDYIVKICDRIANVSHSKTYNKKAFKMYEDEHEVFCINLFLIMKRIYTI